MDEGGTESEMIGIGEAAHLLGVSRSTVWRLIKRGKLPGPERNPALERFKRIELKRSDVEAFKAQQWAAEQ